MNKLSLSTLIAIMVFAQQTVASPMIEIEIEVHTIQANVNAVINVANNCTFTGWLRNEKEVSFYASCDDIKKSITVKDGGSLNSFVVKTVSQEVPIRLDVFKSSGIDWEKLNKALSDNSMTEE